MPAVSIIMNCFNGERFLKEAINSVYEQTYSDWELIFWDNASTDLSADIAKSYDNRLRYFCAPKTTSLGRARNLALRESQGTYIAFLDTDDIYLPDKLSKQVEIMEKNDAALCYGSAILIDESNNVIGENITKLDTGNVFGGLLKRYEINMQSVFVRAKYLKKHESAFDEKLKISPDYNMFLNIAATNNIYVMRDFVVKYRILEASLTRRSYHLIPNEMKYVLDNLRAESPDVIATHKGEFDYAYNMLFYYDAIAYISEGKKKEARKSLLSVLFVKYRYVFLYLLLLSPIPCKKILSLIRK